VSVPPRAAAALQVIAVLGGVFGWLAISDETEIFTRIPAPYGLLLHVGTLGVLAVLLVLAATWRDPHRWRSLGLGRAPLGPVIGWGFAALAVCYFASGGSLILYVTAADLNLGAMMGFAAPTRGTFAREMAKTAEWSEVFSHVSVGWAVLVAVFVGAYEEILFRGFVLGRVRRLFGEDDARARLSVRDASGRMPARPLWALRTVAAIVATSALFALGHVYQGPLGIVRTFALGVVLSVVTVWRGNIWSAIFAHTCVDAVGLILLSALRDTLKTLPHMLEAPGVGM
jgi:uncharacterized protein